MVETVGLGLPTVLVVIWELVVEVDFLGVGFVVVVFDVVFAGILELVVGLEDVFATVVVVLLLDDAGRVVILAGFLIDEDVLDVVLAAALTFANVVLEGVTTAFACSIASSAAASCLLARTLCTCGLLPLAKLTVAIIASKR